MAEPGRRSFLGSAGLLAAVAAGCRPHRDPYSPAKPPVPVPPNLRPGSETWVVSTCGLCRAGCGIRVRVVEGRAVKVEGNPDSPVNRGRLCVRGQAALELLYHADRVPGPRRREGGRGEGRWRAVSWDEAIAACAAELGRLRAAGEPQSLVLLDGEEQGATHALWARLLRAFGSPNHIGHGATGTGATARAAAALVGAACLPGYDFENARLALLVGTGALESSAQSMHLARAIARGARPRLVCAWPRLPPSAALVDEWLPLVPGGAAALLHALAHVLLREGLADESDLPDTPGADEAGGGWRTRVAADCSPDWAESRTGVSARRIEQLARELAASRPSCVVVDEDTGDDGSAAAGLLLNLLLGSYNARGGLLLEQARQVPEPPRFMLDDTAAQGLRTRTVDGREAGQPGGIAASRILALPDAILAAQPYAVKALLLYYSNPAYSKPNAARWREAIAKVPFVVSFSPLYDESARFADLLLPDHTFLERWDVLAPGRGTRVLSQAQPVVRPRHNTMQTGEVLLRLAAALGDGVARALPWPRYRAAVESIIGGAAEAAVALADQGVWLAPAEPGARADDGDGPGHSNHGAGGVRPSPGAPLTDHCRRLLALVGTGPGVSEAEDAVAFPFVLVPFRGLGYAEGGMRHLLRLVELPSPEPDPWQPCIEIAVRDARALGVADGDRVRVESRFARLAMRAHVHDGIRPGVLGLPLGGGAWPLASVEPRPADLLGSDTDQRTGQWLPCATRARLVRVG